MVGADRTARHGGGGTPRGAARAAAERDGMTAWLRARVKYAALLALAATGAFRWARRRLMAERAIVVLMFHRVLEASDEASTHSLPAIVIGRSTFTALLHHLACSADVLRADTQGRFVQ